MKFNEPSDIELSIIAPMYNEEAVIGHSIEKLLSVLNQFDFVWELILVNDGSTDKTVEIAEGAIQGNNRVNVISYFKNRGRGYALRMGIKHSKGKYLVTTESDLTWGKDVVQRLHEELLSSKADIVTASPYAQGGKLENVPFKRMFLSWFGNQILKRTICQDITMLTGMTRGYVGDVIRNISLEQDGKEIHLEIISKGSMLGCQFSEISATLEWEKPETDQPSRKSKFKAGRLIISHLLFGFHESPILLFGVIGGFSTFVGVMIGFYLSYLYFIQNEIIGDRIILIMVAIFLILVGLSMFLFCFLSYQIKYLRQEIFKWQHKIR